MNITFSSVQELKLKMKRNMNTSVNKIENTVRHFANKMNIKLANVEVKFVPSYEYEVYKNETDETNNTYSVSIALSNPSTLSNKKAKNFIAQLEGMFYTNKKCRRNNEVVFIYFDNYDVED